jgi:hypothetical protein
MSLAGGAGLERAELAIRAAVLELGRAVLEPLLAAGAGYQGPRIDCGAGHQAQFASYRDKTIDTVLGPVMLRRAWYHCAACGHGFSPRDQQPGVAGQTMSPGLARMTGRAAAAVPFTAAARLAGELAGITLTGERARRRAEADGQAAARVIEADAAAITARKGHPHPGGRAAAGQAVHLRRWHGRAGHRGRDRRQERQRRGRHGPHPRGQAVLPVHPDHHRREGQAGA